MPPQTCVDQLSALGTAFGAQHDEDGDGNENRTGITSAGEWSVRKIGSQTQASCHTAGDDHDDK